MRTDDESYYRARALQEQIAAQDATRPPVREIHDQLAAMYRFRVAMLSLAQAKGRPRRKPSLWRKPTEPARK